METIYRDRKGPVVKTPSFVTATFPGVTLYGRSAEIISNGIRSNRTCTIQISNNSVLPLTDPQFHCYNGGLYYPLPLVIQPGTREACVFFKDPKSILGVIGILTYQFGDSPQRLAIMFSVPYNQLELRNHFGVAVLDDLDLETDVMQNGALFRRMYHDPTFYDHPGRNHSLANDGVPVWTTSDEYKIQGRMSDRGKSIIKLDIATSL